MRFADRVRAGIGVLMRERHTTPTATSRAMGRGQQFLVRKLDPAYGPEVDGRHPEARPLTVEDVDDALAAMGATPEELVRAIDGGEDKPRKRKQPKE